MSGEWIRNRVFKSPTMQAVQWWLLGFYEKPNDPSTWLGFCDYCHGPCYSGYENCSDECDEANP